ncbi:acyl-CoA carboxylase epsilon subunit [Streptomyces sp. NPDC000987]|uniref:acyl-CoA carboxylase epsilon subunit n=1 Tax=unclassified Streptomyces TaxID=2593676 RepID=UPI002D79B82E|nr:acyl-CoA carboxylase epsilon subunit [Streptomyces sp. H51]
MSATDSADDSLVIRVVKGQAGPADIAALTAVLLARAAALAAAGPGLQDQRPTAAWRRPERIPHHHDPRGWRITGGHPG